MKHYKSYMDRQELSTETHEKLLNLDIKKRTARPWARYGALAACAALVLGVGVWKLAPAPTPDGAGQFASDYTPLPGQSDTAGPEDHPLQTDDGQTGKADYFGFVVSSPVEGDKLMFPMIPYIRYSDRTGSADMSLSREYVPGSFMTDLTKEDIQTIFWGPEGKPQASHPKTEQGDLPWMLFWDGYTVHGFAWYDSQGQLTELNIWGEQGRADFELNLRLGALPFNCCIDMNRGDELSQVNGISVAGWSRAYDQDGDGKTDYICGSEFMTANDIGVRFVNRNSSMRAEYGGDENMELGGAETFNALFVRQALTGGLYLDHLKTAESVPAWREEEFSTLAQARRETDFAPYLPAQEPEGYRNREFYGRLSYQEGSQNMLFVRWSRGYDNVEVCVYRDGYYVYNLADPARPESYDLRLYPIPWSESVPREYWDTVNAPAFRAEDMSPAIVEARGVGKDTGGLSFDFDVLHPDGTVVSYRCDGMTAGQVWDMVEETLQSASN